MTKSEILEHFALIDYAYNNPNMRDDLSRMLDELIAEQQAEIEPSEAEMMVEHTDGTVEYVKDIDSIMLLAHKDYHITYTGAF